MSGVWKNSGISLERSCPATLKPASLVPIPALSTRLMRNVHFEAPELSGTATTLDLRMTDTFDFVFAIENVTGTTTGAPLPTVTLTEDL